VQLRRHGEGLSKSRDNASTPATSNGCPGERTATRRPIAKAAELIAPPSLYRLSDGTYSIDALYFSTFFGGDDATWAPTKDETVDFDDFVICTGPITH
jgi:hypothetical protein